jgi:hypothetical protein
MVYFYLHVRNGDAGWRILCNEVHNVCSSPTIVGVIQSRTMRRGHGRNWKCNILVTRPQGMRPTMRPDIHVRI